MRYTILACLVMVGCSASFSGKKELDEVTYKVTNQLRLDCQLIPFGIGAAWPEGCEAVAYNFIDKSFASLPEARMKMIHAVQVVLDSARTVPGFENYLARPPFTAKHVLMGIDFERTSNEELIDRVAIAYGVIRYKKWSERAQNYETLFEETYEEALQMCQ